jgi:hypothetical protein
MMIAVVKFWLFQQSFRSLSLKQINKSNQSRRLKTRHQTIWLRYAGALKGSQKHKNGADVKNAHPIISHDLIETSKLPALIFAVPMGSRVSASVPTIPVGVVR